MYIIYVPLERTAAYCCIVTLWALVGFNTSVSPDMSNKRGGGDRCGVEGRRIHEEGI
jgi:hypothetical protein